MCSSLYQDIHLAVSDPLALATMFGRYRDEFDVSEGATEYAATALCVIITELSTS